MKKYKNRKRDIYMAFSDLEKAYDSVLRRLIWDSLDVRGAYIIYIDVIKDIYARTRTTVCIPMRNTNFFPLEVGLHYGFFFVIVLNELSKWIHETVL